MSIRKISVALAAEINKYGDGKVHIGLVAATFPTPLTPAARAKIRRLRMQTKQIARQVSGNAVSPTLTFDGTGFDYKEVDGLDLTMENDQELALLDFTVVASFSVSPAVVRFAVNIDNAVDSTQLAEITSVDTAAKQFAGVFTLNIGPGSHRFRLSMTTNSAVTATLTAKQRALRVQGMLGNP